MATNDLLQKLDGGADFGVTTSNRRQTEVFIAKETVAVGDWAAFDLAAAQDGDVTLGIYRADSNSVPIRPAFGVVVASLDTTLAGAADFTAGARIEVCIKGVCDAKVGDKGGAGNAIGTQLQITSTVGVVDAVVVGGASVQFPACGTLAETIAGGVGVTLKRVVVHKSF